MRKKLGIFVLLFLIFIVCFNASWFYVSGTVAFSPTSVAGLRLWLDPSDSGTITKDGSNNVSQINDKSGNGYNFTATGSNQPTLAVAYKNGKDVLYFDNSNRQLTGSPGADLTTYTACATVYYDGRTLYDVLIGQSTSVNNSLVWFVETNIRGMSWWVNGVGQRGNTATDSIQSTTWYVLCSTYTSGDGKTYINNSLSGSGWTTTSNFLETGNMIIGNTTGYSALWAHVGDIVIYDNVVSGTNLTALYNYFVGKYGLP